MRKTAVFGFNLSTSLKIQATTLAICALAASAVAQTRYLLVPIAGSVSAINNSGEITGWLGTTNGAHAFLYKNGRMTDLGALNDAPGSYAFALNSSGSVVGESDIAPRLNEQHAFLYSRGLLMDLGAIVGEGDSYASAINDRGDVAGSFGSRAFLYSKGKILDLGAFTPTSINNQGQIAGYDSAGHGVLYSRGKLKDIGSLGGQGTSANAINERGQIAGNSPTGTGRGGAFLYSEGKMIDLGTTSDLTPLSLAFGLNNNGSVVGEVYSAGLSGVYHAFVYQNGRMFDLNDLAINAPEGLTLLTALGINDSGEIVAQGTFGNADSRSFLLKPVRGHQIKSTSGVR